MFNTIEKIRQKPDKDKKKLAFLVAFFLVGIIFVIWWTIVFPGLKEQKQIEDKNSDASKGALSTFTNALGSGLSAIGEQFSSLKDMISSFSATSTYYTASGTSQKMDELSQ